MNTVEAVKTDNQRQQVEYHLAEAGQIYIDVWKFGINTALRISDLIAIPMDDIRKLTSDRPIIELIEGKTQKRRSITLNSAALAVAKARLEQHPGDAWLFQSDSPKHGQRNPKPITRRSVARVFEAVGNKVTPRVKLSTHSMRKTRGYAMHSAGVSLEAICKVLNHSHPRVTMRYIGLDDVMIQQSYEDFVL